MDGWREGRRTTQLGGCSVNEPMMGKFIRIWIICKLIQNVLMNSPANRVRFTAGRLSGSREQSLKCIYRLVQKSRRQPLVHFVRTQAVDYNVVATHDAMSARSVVHRWWWWLLLDRATYQPSNDRPTYRQQQATGWWCRLANNFNTVSGGLRRRNSDTQRWRGAVDRCGLRGSAMQKTE